MLALAPEATAIWFSPPSSTTITATPVATPSMTWVRDTSMPSLARSATARRPNSSSPIAPTKTTRAPSRAAATAWLAPFPPGWRAKLPPVTVSPGTGIRAVRTTRSTFIDPTTTTDPLPGAGSATADLSLGKVVDGQALGRRRVVADSKHQRIGPGVQLNRERPATELIGNRVVVEPHRNVAGHR